MKRFATTQPTKDSCQRKPASTTYPSVARTRSLSMFSPGSVVLQRKESCACGGGCPRCQKQMLLQTKLKISEPGDKYEQEADRIADEVMRMPEPSVQSKTIANPTPLNSEQSPSEVPPIVHEVLNSPGQPLHPETRTFMESRFKHDFSQVRVHTDARAAESAQAVQAIAYTFGRSVVFGIGQYTPTTIAGRKLIAHELTHVLQQSSDVHHPGKVIRPIGTQIFQRVAIPIVAPIVIPVGTVLLILAVLALIPLSIYAAYRLLMSKLQEIIEAVETVSDVIEKYISEHTQAGMICSKQLIAFREAKQAIIDALRSPAKHGMIIIVRRYEAFIAAVNALTSCLRVDPLF